MEMGWKLVQGQRRTATTAMTAAAVQPHHSDADHCNQSSSQS